MEIHRGSMLFLGMAMWAVATPALGDDSATGLRRSEVVFMSPVRSEPEAVYRAFQGTFVSWGRLPWADKDTAVQEFTEQVVAPARDRGMRYCGSTGFRTHFASMIDFDERFMESVTRDLDGVPILVPWMWDFKHKGHPAYWFCSNAPRYRDFLRHEVRLAMRTNPDGLHIDDYGGTLDCPGGCFCPHCMAAFRRYLSTQVEQETLEEAGVKDLDAFDYGAFLREKRFTADQVREERWAIPLNGVYQSFLVHASAELVRELHACAEQLRGAPLLLSVNAMPTGAQQAAIGPYVTHFSGEMGFAAEELAVPLSTVFVFKMGDALGKPLACTAFGWDWAYVNEHNCPGLVRTWIAQAYAFGHLLMVPHHQWAYTKSKGTHHYDPKPEEFAPLYQFVREHANLFDDHDAVAELAVLYSNRAFRQWHREALDVCEWLAAHNIPFDLVLAGDDWLPIRLTPERLEPYRAIIVTDDAELDTAQEAVLAKFESKIVRFSLPENGEENLPEEAQSVLASAPIAVAGTTDITVVPRARSDAGSPVVCHVLNRNYDPGSDGVTAQRDIRICMKDSLFGARRLREGVLHAPGREPQPLALERTGDTFAVRVPVLELWAIMSLD